MFSVEEGQHIHRTLRLQPGEEIHVLDGRGNLYRAILTKIKPAAAEIQSIVQAKPPPFPLHIGIGILKKIQRLEWFVEKAVELGISEITFLRCDRSVKKNVRMERMRSITLSAFKQSGRFYLPALHQPLSLDQFLEMHQHSQRFIGHCINDEKVTFQNSLPEHDVPITFLVGPEGDFTPHEIARAQGKDFIPVTLSPFRLRTETAAVHVCSIVETARQNFSFNK